MRLLTTIFLIGSVFLGLSCVEEEEQGCFTCLYEKRTTSCGGSGFGSWEDGMSTVDFELRDGLTREDYCRQAYPSNDIECAGGCCISFQFRNVRVGSCP